eukprot:scaffold37901_cov20-Tisochrysis_lutea.AAC.1
MYMPQEYVRVLAWATACLLNTACPSHLRAHSCTGHWLGHQPPSPIHVLLWIGQDGQMLGPRTEQGRVQTSTHLMSTIWQCANGNDA